MQARVVLQCLVDSQPSLFQIQVSGSAQVPVLGGPWYELRSAMVPWFRAVHARHALFIWVASSSGAHPCGGFEGLHWRRHRPALWRFVRRSPSCVASSQGVSWRLRAGRGWLSREKEEKSLFFFLPSPSYGRRLAANIGETNIQIISNGQRPQESRFW